MATTFRGPLQVGPPTGGNTAANPRGQTVVQRSVTVVSTMSGASPFVLPPSNILDMTFVVRTGTSTIATQGAQVRIAGSAGGVDNLGNFLASATRVYRPGIAPNLAFSCASWLSLPNGTNTQLYIDVTAAVAASNADIFDLEGILTITYAIR